MNKTQLDKINKINAQIAELREQLNQIWEDIHDKCNENVDTVSLSGIIPMTKEELIIIFLENSTTCLENAEDEITKINQVYYDKDS